MASVIPGYNYDIFISYRQKDNKGDGWVSQFVEDLKTELEATFKEDVSVYFDENPHDRLQESHDVEKSLESKLKCLIFIPIISQTYCDPESYAWQSEFIPFIRMADKDNIGKDVKLRNGNVASRILPIRIHDLEEEDIKLYEKETGSVLRAIDFVFKTATGVSRPLKVDEDHPKDNINKTFYNDQINKVGHAIKEIILGMKTESAKVGLEKDQQSESIKKVSEDKSGVILEKPAKANRIKLLSKTAAIILLVITGLIVYPMLFKRDTIEKLRASGERICVAVMPFHNLTNDPINWNVYQEIIQNRLTSYLSNYQEYLQVRQPESINILFNSNGLTNFASITPSYASKISKKLDADVFIYGDIIKSGNTILISAQLIDTKTEEVIKSFQIERRSDEENLLPIIDTLSGLVKDFLVISKLKNEKGNEETGDIYFQVTTNSPAAYKYFIYGMDATDNQAALDLFKRAISADTNFVLPYLWAIQMCLNPTIRGNISALDSAKKWCLKIYKKREQVPLMQQYMIKAQYALLFETVVERNKYLRQILDVDDQQAVTYLMLGENYWEMREWDSAISTFKKGLEIYEKWGVKSSAIPIFYHELLQSYYRAGRYIEEKKMLKKFQNDFPEDNFVNLWHAILEFKVGDTIGGNRYVEKWLAIEKKNSSSEGDILQDLGRIYSHGGMPYKASECSRKLLSTQYASLNNLNALAWYLLDDDRTTTEALELAERALTLYPEDHIALHRKGWALYKLGKFREAKEYMQKSWDIRKKKAIYNYELDLHLEAAKKAVADQKNN